MHILMISDVYYPRINGVSTSIQSFTKELIELGHKVTLIAPEYDTEYSDHNHIIRIKSWRVPFDPEDRFMSIGSIKYLIPVLKDLNIDIIHIHTPFVAHYAGTHLAKFLTVPMVTSYHTFFEAYFDKYITVIPNFILKRVARHFSRTQCNSVDGVISPSSNMLNKLKEYGVTKPIRIIPTGLQKANPLPYDTDLFRESHHIDKQAFLLLYVGRVAYEKNIVFLLHVLKNVQSSIENTLLLITGEGPATKSLKMKADQLGISESVRFLGYLDRTTELNVCYQASDVFVFSSETETQGLVLLEAMSNGLPVVSVASMGSTDVLQEGMGCLIAPLEVDTFSRRVIALRVNTALYERTAQNGLSYVKHWSINNKAIELISFYKDVVNSDIQIDG